MKKRNVMVLIILLAIGFAAVSTTLIIYGSIGIGYNEEDFNSSVIYTYANTKTGVKAEINQDGKNIDFETEKIENVNQESILEFNVTNKSRQYDADVTVVCGLGEDFTSFEEYLDVDISLESPFRLNAMETKKGYVTVKMKKAYNDGLDEELTFSCKLVASPIERDTEADTDICDIANPPVKALNDWLWRDDDCSENISVGDLITLDTDSFHVYDVGSEIIKALAQFNLEVGNRSNSKYQADEETNIQSSRAIGWNNKGISTYATVAFSNNDKQGEKPNSYSGSIVEEYVNNYVDILKEKYDVEVIGRLITKEELDLLGCDSSEITCEGAPEWVYSTTYWTSSSDIEDVNKVWDVVSDGYFDTGSIFSDLDCGVRPVIEISRPEFE